MRYKIRNKHEKSDKSDNHSYRHVIENHVGPTEMSSKESKETPDEAIATKQTPELLLLPTDQTPELIEPEKMLNGNGNGNDNDVLPINEHALEEGEIDDSSNDIEPDIKSNTKSIPHEPSAKSRELSDFTGKFVNNVQNTHDVVKAEEKSLDVPKLVAVNMTPTAEVHIACATPTVPIEEYDCVQEQREEQQQQQQCQLLNGMANGVVEEAPNEEEQFNGIPMETQSLDHVDVYKVELPLVNEPKIIDTEKNGHQQKSSAETLFRGWEPPRNNFIDTKQQPENENQLEVKLEDSSHQDAPIPQINDSTSNNSPESHKTLEPIDDSSNSLHNTSGGKAVNISTSKRDFLIVEDENNEQIIYVSRKKKKTKKEKKNKSTDIL